MSPIRREKMLAILDDSPELPTILWHFDKLTRCDEVLDWCLRNKVTGKKLVAFYQEKGCSILALACDILRRINAETVSGKIIAGKDYHV